MEDEEQHRYFDPIEASAYLKKKGLPAEPQTLAKYRSQGGGPLFSLFGRFPRYRQDWLDEFAELRISGPMRSTSDRQAATASRNGAHHKTAQVEIEEPAKPRAASPRRRQITTIDTRAAATRRGARR